MCSPVCIHVHVCACIGKPEDDFGCPPQSLSIFCIDSVSYLNLELSQSASLAIQLALGSSYSHLLCVQITDGCQARLPGCWGPKL